MHEKVLPRGSLQLLDALERLQTSALSGWVLAGGTGLALQLGHRVSEDFDFFRTDDFDLARLRDALTKLGSFETLRESDRDLTALVLGVKLAFFLVSEPFVHPPLPWRFAHVAAEGDIALMKLVAISSRGSRRDFVDLYSILRSGPRLEDLFRDLPAKYGKGRVNTYHVLKSLAYFDDAEREPMPQMLQPFDWAECKAFFLRQALAIVL